MLLEMYTELFKIFILIVIYSLHVIDNIFGVLQFFLLFRTNSRATFMAPPS